MISVLVLALLLIWYSNKPAEKSTVTAPEDKQETVSADARSYHDYLRDPDFFDEAPPGKKPQVAVSSDGAARLYLTAGSVMKDIRVSITDSAGKPVSGYPFYVTVDEVNEYKDLDRDGLIYIPDMGAGDHFVQLKEYEGFTVPEEPMRVAVKDRLEYNVIEDIVFYIHDESEINVAVEDTAVQEAGSDADETENTGRWAGTDAAFGIDVSKYQKDIDWKRAAADGVEFAIIRCGYRGSGSGTLVEDPYFKKNLEGARAAGVGVGLYFFTQAVNEVEAVEEASMAVSLLEGSSIEYPIFIDVEGAGGNGRADGLDKATRTKVVRVFCETVKAAGYHGGVYSGRYWFKNNMDDDALQDYVHWLAEYRSSPLYKGKFSLWQYTSSGHIDGIEGRVDLDMVWQNGGEGE